MRMLGICGLAVVVVAAACGKDAAPPPTERLGAQAPKDAPANDPSVVRIDATMLRDLHVTVAPVEARPGSEDVSLLGELAIDERTYAEVGVPVPSRALQLLAAPGDRVSEGQVLAELQSSDAGRARSDYLSARARQELASATLQRKRDLVSAGVAPVRELQEAEAEVSAATAALRSAAATLTSLGLPLPKPDDPPGTATYELRSPVRGTVIDRRVARGQIIEPSVAAFRIGDLSTLWLTVHAFERDAVRIRVGSPARVTFPALPGQAYQGTVSLVGREVSRESRTIPVRIDVSNQDGKLRPGMSATAGVPVGESSSLVLAVPVAAVQRVRDRWCVFVPKDGSTYEVREIGRGRDLGADVEVLSGLKAGERIVIDGAFLLKAQAEKSEGGRGHGA